MSKGKRTLREYKNGPGRARVVRKPTPQVVAKQPEVPSADVETTAEENLTYLGEQESQAESENETADLDSVEAPPMSYGSID